MHYRVAREENTNGRHWLNCTIKLFGEKFDEAHNAAADVAATARCFFELLRQDVITSHSFENWNPWCCRISETAIHEPIKPFDHQGRILSNYNIPAANETAQTMQLLKLISEGTAVFTHLHVHTQYSILDGAAVIKSLIAKAKNDNMEAIAITDHGNMFGAKEFHNEAKKQGIKPILGCEVYVARRSRHEKSDKQMAVDFTWFCWQKIRKDIKI